MKIQVTFDDIPSDMKLTETLVYDKPMYIEIGNTNDYKFKFWGLQLDSQDVSFDIGKSKQISLGFSKIEEKESK